MTEIPTTHKYVIAEVTNHNPGQVHESHRPITPLDLIRDATKLHLPENRFVMGKRHLGTVPVDQEAMAQYMSVAQGFVRPENGIIHSLNSGTHYGLGAFEGIRIFRTAFGSAFPLLSRNLARFLYSGVGISPEYLATVLGVAKETSIQIPQRSDERIFMDFTACLEAGGEPSLWFNVLEGETWVKKQIPWTLNAVIYDHEKREYGVKPFTAYELDAIIKMLAYLNGLVDVGNMPATPEMVMSGYFRPFFYVDAQGGLGISTYTGAGIKPLSFSIATLPWKLYLKEQDYETGLEVLVAPFERIGADFITGMKIAGHYVNSLLNINIGNILGQGEILALTRDGKAVEGSAENLFVIKKIGNTHVAYTPPLSDGPLMGTNRRMMIENLQAMGIEVEYKSCTLDEIKEGNTVAVFFTGTGAQTIHLKSINEIHGVSHIPDALRVKDPNGTDTHMVHLEKLSATPILINNGEKHPIMREIQTRYKQRWVDAQNTILEPAYMIRKPEAIATALGLDFSDVIKNRYDRRLVDEGFLNDRFNTFTNPKGAQEVFDRHQLVARMISNAMKAQARRGPDFRLPIRRAHA